MKKSPLIWLILLLSVPPLAASPTLSLNDLDLPKTFFPFEPTHSTIQEIERSRENPGFLKFKVVAAHASYEVEGLVPLQKLLREIQVIEQVQKGEAGSGFAEGVGDSVVATGEGAVNLVAHPIQSVQGIGKAAGKLGIAIGRTFREKEVGEDTTFDEKMLGASEREIANKLGVDVYTTNPHLKVLLERMAKSRFGGKGVTTVAKLLIPVVGIAAVAITAAGLNSAADQIVNDTGRADLFRINKNALLDLGLDEEAVRKLLNSSYYSPREVTYLRFYLEQLKDVAGFRDILKRANAALSPGSARKILYETQIAAAGLAHGAKFERIQPVEEGLALVESKRLILVAPYDYLEVSPLGNHVRDRALVLQKEWGKGAVEIWNGGRVTPDFRSSVFLKGIKVRDGRLFT